MPERKTITQAIIEVLKRESKPLSINDIHERITKDNLFTFNTKNPEHVVRNQLRRHCENIQLRNASATKYFTHLPDGTYALRN